jgi:hypothetical protein
MAVDFLRPERRQQTIDDHVAFARDVLTVCGCTYFKINMGARPKRGTTAVDVATIADALNALGRATAALGIRLARTRTSGGRSSGQRKCAGCWR